jgi:hypothetical protein
MNERIKYKKVMRQMDDQAADTKANSSVSLFIHTEDFLHTILASRINGTLGFAHYTSRHFAKPTEPFFANAPLE